MGTDEVKISVIVPVYNSEPYLTKCVASLRRQKLTSWEAFFVDDGSTDNSVKILQKYEKLDSRIHILRQEHKFAGAARNYGLEHARGKYVIFLDSDDLFVSTFFDESYKCAEREQAEVVICGYNTLNAETGEIKKAPFADLPTNVFSAKDLGENVFQRTTSVPWDKLIRRDFLLGSGIRFQEIKNGNDEYFSKMIACMASRMIYKKSRLVLYRTNNNNSLQGNLKKKNLDDILCGFEIIPEVRKGLHRVGIIDITMWDSFYRYACAIADSRLAIAEDDRDTLRQLYAIVKTKVLPNYFEKVCEFENDANLYSVYQSGSFEEYLYLRMKHLVKENREYQNNYVPTSLFEYRIGKKVAYLPRRIKTHFEK